ncbi:hypothetical protein V5O48_016892 [Marasmius crinis-equi]|uniref:Uncharacterized protein n=1 Tax=Marasmius crinis-equi TaxID=585013 RepID=A0ABR3EQH0_9AGAR
MNTNTLNTTTLNTTIPIVNGNPVVDTLRVPEVIVIDEEPSGNALQLFLTTNEFSPTPLQLANPFSAIDIRDEALRLIQQRVPMDEYSLSLLTAMSQSVSSLQAIMDDKNQDLEQAKRDLTVATARTEVHRKISELHKKGSIDGHQKASVAQREIDALKKEIATLKQKVKEVDLQKREVQQMMSGLIRKAGKFAEEGLRGRRGNVLWMVPDIRQSIRSARFEIMATDAQLKITSGIPGDHALCSSVQRALRLIDDTIRLLDQIERASKDIVGDISESSSWDKKLRRAARGFRVDSIKEVVQRIRAFNPTIQRPFTVNTTPIWSFLGGRGGSDRSTASTSGSMGENMPDVNGWRSTAVSAASSNV